MVFAGVIIALNFVVKDQKLPAIVQELSNLKERYKEFGIATFIIRNIYYILEAMLMTLIVVLSQIWGDKKFTKDLIHYGGFVLALTWGLVHILTKDLATGIYAAVAAFIVGVGFKLCNKNLLLTYLLAPFIFIF